MRSEISCTFRLAPNVGTRAKNGKTDDCVFTFPELNSAYWCTITECSYIQRTLFFCFEFRCCVYRNGWSMITLKSAVPDNRSGNVCKPFSAILHTSFLIRSYIADTDLLYHKRNKCFNQWELGLPNEMTTTYVQNADKQKPKQAQEYKPLGRKYPRLKEKMESELL
jgi:hypothetical protein